VANLSALEELDASHNALVSLPAEIDGWQAMRRLVLSENELKALPASFCRLAALTHCFLHRNRLSDLPSAGSDECLPALQFLNLHGNPFPKDWQLPSSYRKAKRL